MFVCPFFDKANKKVMTLLRAEPYGIPNSPNGELLKAYENADENFDHEHLPGDPRLQRNWPIRLFFFLIFV